MHGDSARGEMAIELCEGETTRCETARVRRRLTYLSCESQGENSGVIETRWMDHANKKRRNKNTNRISTTPW